MIKWLKSLFKPSGGYTQQGYNPPPDYPRPPAPPMPPPSRYYCQHCHCYIVRETDLGVIAQKLREDADELDRLIKTWKEVEELNKRKTND